MNTYLGTSISLLGAECKGGFLGIYPFLQGAWLPNLYQGSTPAGPAAGDPQEPGVRHSASDWS